MSLLKYCYRYPRPAVTVDLAIFRPSKPWSVLLIKRSRDPYKDHWALPGGFVDENEDLEVAARRELKEETNLTIPIDLKQVKAYGQPGRDPRGHTISVAYTCLLDGDLVDMSTIKAGDDACATKWVSLYELPPLAFDHHQIITDALKKFPGKFSY